jgi:hypothetical protein
MCFFFFYTKTFIKTAVETKIICLLSKERLNPDEFPTGVVLWQDMEFSVF